MSSGGGVLGDTGELPVKEDYPVDVAFQPWVLRSLSERVRIHKQLTTCWAGTISFAAADLAVGVSCSNDCCAASQNRLNSLGFALQLDSVSGFQICRTLCWLPVEHPQQNVDTSAVL